MGVRLSYFSLTSLINILPLKRGTMTTSFIHSKCGLVAVIIIGHVLGPFRVNFKGFLLVAAFDELVS